MIEEISTKRKYKGKSLLELPKTYTIIDIETTGLDPKLDDILEVSAIKVINNKTIDSFTSFVSLPYSIPDFIKNLTGITNEMIENAPAIEKVLLNFYNFIGNDILVGHNINFDINFLYDNLEKYHNIYMKNNFIDTLRLSRKINSELKHHKLSSLIEFYNIETSKQQHRALNDCEYEFIIYNNIKNSILEKYNTVENFNKEYYNKTIAKEINDKTVVIDTDNYFYQKNVVFTGTLQKMTRKEAMTKIATMGGINSDSINKSTNILVIGEQDYSKINGTKSSKQRKAEQYIELGYDLEIITENVFYDLIK